METKNIAAILRNKPQGTKLYSPICGKLTLNAVDSDGIFCKTDNNQYVAFTNDGKYKSYGKWLATGECLLFPSKAMQDWSKFTWKKGDVLTTYGEGRGKVYCVFTEWKKEDYSEFYCDWEAEDYFNRWKRFNWYITEDFRSANDSESKKHLSELETRYDGKLNLETLEIEKPKPQFKDGDIVRQEVLRGTNIYIIKTCVDKIDNKYDYYARYNTQDKKTNYNNWSYLPYAKLATDSEKQLLFDALAKVDKAWDAEKKAIVDLPKKHVFKPFDKVLMRDNKEDEWKPSFFLKEVDGAIFPYYCINDNENRKYCIPYEGNEHLLGTTDDWKGGENG